MNNSDADEFDIISIPAAPELYRGHGSAVSLQLLVVGKRHCRVLRLYLTLPPQLK